jgi:hypothetical protein
MPGAVQVAEPVAVLVLRHLAEEFGAVGAQAGDGVVDVVDGEHDTMQAQSVGRRVRRSGADRRGAVVLRQSADASWWFSFFVAQSVVATGTPRTEPARHSRQMN